MKTITCFAVFATLFLGAAHASIVCSSEDSSESIGFAPLESVEIDSAPVGDSNAASPTAAIIPEPGTYGAIAGILALGVVAWRRRRS